jgi:hypothetical protein
MSRRGRTATAPNQKGYAAGYNGQLVVTADQVIVGAMLSWHPAGRTLLHPLPAGAGTSWQRPGSARSCAPSWPAPVTPASRPSPAPTPAACGCSRRWPKTPAGATSARRSGPGTLTGFRPPPGPGGG